MNERISHLKRPPLRRGGRCGFTHCQNPPLENLLILAILDVQNGWLVVIPLLSFDFCVFVHTTHTHTSNEHTRTSWSPGGSDLFGGTVHSLIHFRTVHTCIHSFRVLSVFKIFVS
jgi:hypothetical protein